MDPEPVQDVLKTFVVGEMLQLEVDADLQTCPNVGRRTGHPSQLLLPDERVSELPVGLLQLEKTSRGDPSFSLLIHPGLFSIPNMDPSQGGGTSC